MKNSCSVLFALAFVIGMSAAAMAASVGGMVGASQGQSVAGVQIIIKDSTGHLIAEGTTGSSGMYDISGVQPGNYNFTLDPGSSGYQGQTVASYVGPDGICLNWGVSTTSPAVATAQPGSTCQPLAAGWGGTSALVGGGAAVLGAGGIAAAAVIGLSGGSSHGHKTSKSTSQ